MSNLPIEVLGRFSVYEQIGSGGMAVVHRAIETLPNGTERVVALKRLHETYSDNEVFVDTFVREARITQVLDHPNIVQTYSHGPIPGSHFISMEFIQGHSLLKVLRASSRRRIPVPVVVSLLQDLFRGLHYMHSKSHRGEDLGLIHRDISPANLIIDSEGRLRIIDFGVAKAALAGLQTGGNVVKGKLSYLAPECLRPTVELDARTDIYSAGVVAHELLSGRPLFTRKKSRAETIESLLSSRIQPPSLFNNHCPPALSSLVMEALARDKNLRVESAAVALEKLDEIAESLLSDVGHEQVAHFCEISFGPVDHAAASASPTEESVPEYDSYEVGTPLPSRSRFPAGTLPTKASTPARMSPKPPHMGLLTMSPGGKNATPRPAELTSQKRRAHAASTVLDGVRITFHADKKNASGTSSTAARPRQRTMARGTTQMETLPTEAPESSHCRGTTLEVKSESFPRRVLVSSAQITALGIPAILIAILLVVAALAMLASGWGS